MIERPIIFSAPMIIALLEGRKTQTRRPVKSPVKDREISFLPEHYNDPEEKDFYQWGDDTSRDNPEAWGIINFIEYDPLTLTEMSCPFGEIGDRLWVREKFKIIDAAAGFDRGMNDERQPGGARIEFQADMAIENSGELVIRDDGKDEGEQAVRFFKKGTVAPSIHMPRWASRILLEITDVRVERLHAIDDNDALEEGIEYTVTGDDFEGDTSYHCKNYMANGSVVYKASENSDLDEDITDHELAVSEIESFKSLWQSINDPASWDANPFVWVIQFSVIAKNIKEQQCL